MKWFRKWKLKRKKKREVEQYRLGFCWAMAEYFIEDLPLDEIIAYTEAAKIFNSYNKFDSGAEDAVEKIVSNLGGPHE